MRLRSTPATLAALVLLAGVLAVVAATSFASAAASCTVPKLAGKSAKQLRSAILHAHCKVGRVTFVASKKVVRGRVVSTSPAAGKHLRAGAKVSVVVSTGKPVAASHVVHLSAAAVRRNLFVAARVAEYADPRIAAVAARASGSRRASVRRSPSTASVASGSEATMLNLIMQTRFARDPSVSSATLVSEIQALQALLTPPHLVTAATVELMAPNERDLAILNAFQDDPANPPGGAIGDAIRLVTYRALLESANPGVPGAEYVANPDALGTLESGAFNADTVLSISWELAAAHPNTFGAAWNTLFQGSGPAIGSSLSLILLRAPVLQSPEVASFVSLVRRSDGTITASAKAIRDVFYTAAHHLALDTTAATADANNAGLSAAERAAHSDLRAPLEVGAGAAVTLAADALPADEILTNGGEIKTGCASCSTAFETLHTLGGTIRDVTFYAEDLFKTVADANEKVSSSIPTVAAAGKALAATLKIEKEAKTFAKIAKGLSGAAMAGNLVSVIADLIPMILDLAGVTGPSQEDQIQDQLKELQKSVDGLRRHLDVRFDDLDATLVALDGHLTRIEGEVQATHHDVGHVSAQVAALAAGVDRLQSNMYADFASLAEQPLSDAVHSALGYTRNGNGGLSLDGFNGAESKFFNWSKEGGVASGAPFVAASSSYLDTDIATQLGIADPLGALDANADYLRQLAPELSLPSLGSTPVVNPQAWALGAIALSALALENPAIVGMNDAKKASVLDDLAGVARAGQGVKALADRIAAADAAGSALITPVSLGVGRAVAADPGGGYWTAQVRVDGSSYLFHVSTAGAVDETFDGGSTVGAFRNATSIAVDTHFVWMAGLGGVELWDRASRTARILPFTSPFPPIVASAIQGKAVTLGPDGQAWAIAAFGSTTLVFRMSSTTGTQQVYLGADIGGSIVTGEDGRVWAATGTHVLRFFTGQPGGREAVATAPRSTDVGAGADVVVSADGGVWALEASGTYVSQFRVWGASGARYALPGHLGSLVVDAHGRMWGAEGSTLVPVYPGPTFGTALPLTAAAASGTQVLAAGVDGSIGVISTTGDLMIVHPGGPGRTSGLFSGLEERAARDAAVLVADLHHAERGYLATLSGPTSGISVASNTIPQQSTLAIDPYAASAQPIDLPFTGVAPPCAGDGVSARLPMGLTVDAAMLTEALGATSASRVLVARRLGLGQLSVCWGAKWGAPKWDEQSQTCYADGSVCFGPSGAVTHHGTNYGGPIIDQVSTACPLVIPLAVELRWTYTGPGATGTALIADQWRTMSTDSHVGDYCVTADPGSFSAPATARWPTGEGTLFDKVNSDLGGVLTADEAGESYTLAANEWSYGVADAFRAAATRSNPAAIPFCTSGTAAGGEATLSWGTQAGYPQIATSLNYSSGNFVKFGDGVLCSLADSASHVVPDSALTSVAIDHWFTTVRDNLAQQVRCSLGTVTVASPGVCLDLDTAATDAKRLNGIDDAIGAYARLGLARALELDDSLRNDLSYVSSLSAATALDSAFSQTPAPTYDPVDDIADTLFGAQNLVTLRLNQPIGGVGTDANDRAYFSPLLDETDPIISATLTRLALTRAVIETPPPPFAAPLGFPSASAVASGGVVNVAVACPAIAPGACRGSVTLAATTGSVIYGATTISLPAGSQTTVSVPLTGDGGAALAAGTGMAVRMRISALMADVEATARANDGHHAASTGTVVVTATG